MNLNNIPLPAAVISSVLLLGSAWCLFMAVWPGLKPRRGKRRAGRRLAAAPMQAPEALMGLAALQLPGLGPMAASDVDGEHDWDGWLQALTAAGDAAFMAEPEPTLREQRIEIQQRDGEGDPDR